MAKKKGIKEATLDAIFSTYIRLRDADEYGGVTCCNCGQYHHWKDSTCGHFVKRSHRTLRWDPRNAHAECAECNGEDLNLGYNKFMIKKYGVDIFDQLASVKLNRTRIMPFERKIMAEGYRKEIKKLKKQKNL